MNLKEINKIIVAIDDELHDPTDCSLQDKFDRRTKLMTDAGKILNEIINEQLIPGKKFEDDTNF